MRQDASEIKWVVCKMLQLNNIEVVLVHSMRSNKLQRFLSTGEHDTWVKFSDKFISLHINMVGCWQQSDSCILGRFRYLCLCWRHMGSEIG